MSNDFHNTTHVESRSRAELRNFIIQSSTLLEISLSGLVLIGLVLPTALETWLLFFSPKEFEESRKAHWISAASDAGVLVGGFMLRLLVILAALPVLFL